MPENDWISDVESSLDSQGNHGGFLLLFPQYRPDLIRTLSHRLGYAPIDFRAQVMMPQGWDADQITLDSLDAFLTQQAEARPAVVNNVEALLVTKTRVQIQEWAKQFLATEWANPLLVPMCVLSEYLPPAHRRVHRLSPSELPEQTFVGRLMF